MTQTASSTTEIILLSAKVKFFNTIWTWKHDVMPNTHRQRRRDSTVELNRVVGVYWIHEWFTMEIENWTCWEFIQWSWLQNWKLGHDCRRVSIYRPTQLNSTQHVHFFLSNASAVVVSYSCEFNTPRDADAIQLDSWVTWVALASAVGLYRPSRETNHWDHPYPWWYRILLLYKLTIITMNNIYFKILLFSLCQLKDSNMFNATLE